VGTAGTMNLPALQAINSGTFSLGVGATFNAPNLVSLTNSTLAVNGSSTFLHGAMTSLDYSQISVTSGATFAPGSSLSSYRFDGYRGDWSGSYTILSADGTGSLLDLSGLSTFNGASYSNGTSYTYSVSASNNGVVDLSNVTTFIGAQSDEWLKLSVSDGGTIKLNSLTQTTGRVWFDANTGGNLYMPSLNLSSSNSGIKFVIGPGGKMTLGSVTLDGTTSLPTLTDSTSSLTVKNLWIRSTGSLSMPTTATLGVNGNFVHDLTDETKLSVNNGTFQFSGGGIQYLELAGLDMGAADPGNNGNFGFGQMAVGLNTQTSVVELTDSINNGNRVGGGATPEALYLFGLGGPNGLVLKNGSTLVLHNYNVYSMQGGSWVSLQSLFGSQNFIPYNGGFLSRNLADLPGEWNVNSSGVWSHDANWKLILPSGVGVTAVFGEKITAPRTVTVDMSVNLGAMVFDNANAYAIVGSMPINLATNGGNATIRVDNTNGNGSHTIATRLNLFDDLNLINNSTGTLTLSGTINPQNHNITKLGIGPIVIEQSIITTGDLLLDQGSLQLLGANCSFGNIGPSNSPMESFVPSGRGDLIVGDATHNTTLTTKSIRINSLTIGTPTGSQAVPEPSVIMLLCIGILGVFGYVRCRN
jgi:hypothetical protein